MTPSTGEYSAACGDGTKARLRLIRVRDPATNCLDKTVARRTRLTGEIAQQVNAAVMSRGQAHRILARVYGRARTMALRGDLCPAEALRDYLGAYLPALRGYRFGRRGWTAMSLAMTEMRLLRATLALCSGGGEGG